MSQVNSPDAVPAGRDGDAGRDPGGLAPLLPGGEPVEGLLRRAQFFVPGEPSGDFREVHRKGGRGAEEFYRERWRHDKVVRSTHGVNCTGSCSWKVYVKDGIITWETQQTDYPSTGPDMPEYEPRGCPRGASFSWYTYSPSRVRYPYVRGELLEIWREARARLGDPVAAWAEITADPQRTARYKQARGMGGLVRSDWPEVSELIAAAHVHTIREYGPDRVVGFSPIPAMSQVSYAAGTRFLSMIGGTILSFYDWYADMPVASPQVFGDQTDVPESGDWWNSSYLIIWGTNLPITRTPDAHFMTEARYRGQKVVVVCPDYSDHTKFADDWLAAAPGTDGRRGVPAIRVGGRLVTTVFDLLLAPQEDEMTRDPVITNPGLYTVIFENDRVRVLEYRDTPGATTSPHWHPDSVMYTLSSFRRRLNADGRDADVRLPAGQVCWLAAQQHSGHNTGDTNTHVIFVELKDPPAGARSPATRLGPGA